MEAMEKVHFTLNLEFDTEVPYDQYFSDIAGYITIRKPTELATEVLNTLKNNKIETIGNANLTMKACSAKGRTSYFGTYGDTILKTTI